MEFRKQGNNEDTSSKAMLAIDGVGFDWSDMAEEQCDDLIVKLNQAEFTAATYKRGLATIEAQLIRYRKNEFKEPEFKGYGPDNKEQVSQDTSRFVESSPNVDKEIVFPVNKKVEFTKPKNHEKPVKKSVSTINCAGAKLGWEAVTGYLLEWILIT
ncbi:hypothetical protein Tco_0688080 [Tanacetum coccineum]